MGKTSVEHQGPDAPSSKDHSAKADDNDYSASVHDGHRSSTPTGAVAAVATSSREVFQGLFQDLGKQAMAMETILRIVCGKVDSMETWMTEISFGMTELDLKLRNIAHNIEGTAANVDDEAANVYRWAAPPPDDSAAAARAAATVKKKLGPNKTTVRMTGMVASIIDTLGAPVEERDKAVAAVAATTGKRPKKSLVAAVALKKAHKKKPGHQHHHDKAKGHDEEGGHSRGSSVDNTAHSRSSTDAAQDPSSTANGADANAGAASESHATTSDSREAQPVPPLAEQTVPDSEAEGTDGGESTARSAQDSDRSAIVTQVASAPAAQVASPAQASPEDIGSDSHVAQPAPPVDQSGSFEHGAAASAPAVYPPQGSNEVSSAQDAGAPATDEPAQEPLSNANAMPHSADQTLSDSVSQPAPGPPRAPVESPAMAQPVPRHTEPPTTSVSTSRGQNAVPASAPSSSGYLPLPPQDTASPSFVLHTAPAAATAVSAPPEAVSMEPSGAPTSAATPSASADALAAASTSGSQGGSSTTEVAAVAKSSSRKAAKTASSSSGESLLRKSSSRKKAPIEKRKSKRAVGSSDDADPLGDARTAASTEADAIESAAETEALAPVATSPSSATPAHAAEPETARGDGAAIATSRSNPVESESEASSSSSSESGSQSDSQGDGNDDSGGDENAADDAARKSGGPNASTMTRTITALKKLKKANMLTAEEEEELKQRAQEKWFKLKGHMKEKKKKDVANILLKRKKNVFTVSARIELLEEKSKEVFASIKQLTADLKTKVDVSANESLRRHVHDINVSLQALDHRLNVGATPAMERVTQLAREVESMRSSLTQRLVLASDDLAATKRALAATADEHRCALEVMRQAFDDQVASLQAASDAKLRELPDHTAALEGIKRAVRRKADLKQLKELEARLLGHDAESEDCLVRCLSCHKEVVNIPSAEADATADAAGDDERGAYLKKVNPGPSAGKIYRSNVPFSAQLLGAYESIPEDAAQVPSDAHASDRPLTPAAPAAATPKTTTARRDESSRASVAVAPISAIQITASRAAMSPDRPISAPATALKKKAPYVKSKSLLPPK